VIVGIDKYVPAARGTANLSERAKARMRAIQGKPSRTALLDLDGAVNDAESIQALLIKRFGFEKQNIVFLANEKATADAILNAVQTHLIDAARSGDISLFYYAGHGSRIRNTLTLNTAGKDSTLIPADALIGAPDIRSKELVRIYQQAPKKGVQLTVIQDSCFSGAGARGLFPVSKTRAQDEDPQISVAERLEGDLPENQGVLILTASQDYQPSQELRDPELGVHGAFSWALLRVLATSPVNERADRIFQRTRALMQSKVLDQEPVLLARSDRKEQGLFGQPSDSRGVTVAVGYVDAAKKQLELNAGLAMRLHPGCELKRVEPASPPLRIRVTEVNGPASSNAEVIAPGAITGVQEGNLFQLEKWVAPDEELLRVYIGPAIPAELRSALQLGPTVAIVDTADRADYALIGRPASAGKMEYAWVLPSLSSKDLRGPAPQAVRPPRTDWIGISNDRASIEDPARQLRGLASKLANVVGWLNLQSPAEASFPYRLELRDAASKQASDGRLTGDHRYKMFLKRDPAAKLQDAPRRRVYVFVVDSNGKSQLAFGTANLGNEIPRPEDDGKYPDEIPLTKYEADLRVSEPYGVDHYFVLSTSQPIDDPKSIFESEGVVTRSMDPVKAPKNPLERLISSRAAGTRGAISGVPTDWSIERTSFRSLPPEK
jgi:uncharacterized caspase-like protein